MSSGQSLNEARLSIAREDGPKYDVWTTRLDLILKAIIALATIAGPIALAALQYQHALTTQTQVKVAQDQIQKVDARVSKVQSTATKLDAATEKVGDQVKKLEASLPPMPTVSETLNP